MFLSSLPSQSPLSCLSSLFPFLCSFLPFFIIYFFPLLLPWFSSFSLHSLLPVEVFPFSLLMCLSSFLLPSFYFFSLLFLVLSVFSVFLSPFSPLGFTFYIHYVVCSFISHHLFYFFPSVLFLASCLSPTSFIAYCLLFCYFTAFIPVV